MISPRSFSQIVRLAQIMLFKFPLLVRRTMESVMINQRLIISLTINSLFLIPSPLKHTELSSKNSISSPQEELWLLFAIFL